MELFTGDKGFYRSYSELIPQTIEIFFKTLSFIVLPFPRLITVILFINLLLYALVRARQDKEMVNILLLLLWIFLPFMILIAIKHDILEHYFIPVIPGIILFISYGLVKLWSKNMLLGVSIFLILLIVNSSQTSENIAQNKEIFFQATQPELKYSDQKAVLQYIYTQTGSNPFSYQAYTIPYWMMQGWEYLFWQYAESNDQPEPVPFSNNLFILIQRDRGNTQYQADWLKEKNSSWGTLISEKIFGEITVRHYRVTQ
jgi:hypothetical protein